MVKRLLLTFAFLFVSLPAQAEMSVAFSSWFDSFAQEAVAQGVTPSTLHSVLPYLSYDESVVELDQKQPEKTISFAQYLKNTLSDSRVAEGRELMREHADFLKAATQAYGVPSSVIVALWGIESSFGANTGDYDVINSVATLAYEGRRAALFRKELVEALLILQEERRSPDMLKGSWAGAMGQCQFMPSTYRAHAVDFDQDGVRDIWDSPADVIGSIASYLSAEGWRAGVPWGVEVKVTKPVPAELVGLEVQKSADAWSKLGLAPVKAKKLPAKAGELSLIQPDGAKGRSFLVTDNYRAIMKWNRSTYFATSVGLFSTALEVKP